MEILYNSDLNNEAIKNGEGFNFTKMSYKEIFDKMRAVLVYAFDDVTTFDMRTTEQIKPLLYDLGYVVEKDLKIYPATILTLQIMDWDARNNCKDIWRKANFQLKLTPFRCELEKAEEKTGVYGGYDKELTKVWRGILKEKYPAWEEAFKQYVWDVRDLKVDKAQREYDDILEKANNEYHEEIDSLNV